MMNGKMMHMASFILLAIGGINWGLIGLSGFLGTDWNVVKMIFGNWPTLEWIIYILVGLSAVMILLSHKKDCKVCSGGMGMMK